MPNYKPEVLVGGKWSQNALVFATKEEAEDNAVALMFRWFAVQDSRAVESNDPVNYIWDKADQRLIPNPGLTKAEEP